MQLRPYQEEIIEKARALMKQGEKRLLIQSATGSGKTLLTAHMLRSAAEKGIDCWFIVHRRELIKQSCASFTGEGVAHGVVANNFYHDPRHLVQICSIQTLANRYARLRKPKLIVWDECHHIAARSWAKIHAAFPEAFHIGLTATPQRLDGKGLGDWFDHIINGPSVRWLIENNFLSDYRIFAPHTIDVSGIRTQMGDFAKGQLNAATDKPSITGDAIKEYKKYANGSRAVVFCVSVEHSKHVAEQFNAAGIPSAHVDGETPTNERDKTISAFHSGSIQVLCNVDLFGEGFDLPSIGCGILLRPTQSMGLHLQQIGRTLRPNADKSESIILDHAGNCLRHGLPDEDRDWSLEDKEKGQKANTQEGPKIRLCKKCFAVQPPGNDICQYCGELFEIESRKVEVREGELVEINAAQLRRQKAFEQARAVNVADLIAIGHRRGYRNPSAWAHYVAKARLAKRMKRGAGG